MLPDDVLDRLKSFLSEEDTIAFTVALKQSLAVLDITAWSTRAVATVCDPWTRRFGCLFVYLHHPPPRVIRVLPAFGKVLVLNLEDVREEISLGMLCSFSVQKVSLFGCTLQGADPSLPKALSTVHLRDCKILLGPAGRQWTVLTSTKSSVSSLELWGCALEDVHDTGALPLTSPRLKSLSVGSCKFLSKHKEPVIFGEVSKSVKDGGLVFDFQRQFCNR